MSRVQAYYDQNADAEWTRADRHRTEFSVALRVVRRHLAPPPATVLDIGSGPGRYSIVLAHQGYRVTLCDLSPVCLALAQKKARAAGVSLDDVICANAVDLSVIRSARFDGVLLMGPLYHLLTEQARLSAIKEARRVLKPHGVLFATFITRFAIFRDAAIKDPESVIKDVAETEQLLATGVNSRDGVFTDAYFAHPDEIIPIMEGAGLHTLGLYALEGVVAGHEQRVSELSGLAWEYWVDLNYRMSQEPSLRGAADHLMYVGRPRYRN